MKEFTPPIQSLYTYLKNLAEKQPEKCALGSYTKSGDAIGIVSYAELFELVGKVGKWMVYKDLKAGDRVAIQFTNSIELLVLSWTAWCLGIVSVPLDTKRDTEADVKYKTELTEAKYILNPENFNFNIIEKDLAGIEGDITIPWREDLSHEALILFTSGTTGRPKGASLSLQNLIANGDGIREWFSITPEDRFMVILPLHHINSTSFCFASLLGGASIAIPYGYSASKFWAQVAGSQATFTSIVPTICYDQISQLSEYVKHHDALKLKKIQIGSAPVKPSDVKKFMDLYEAKLYQGYGQTETALRVTGIPHDLPDETYKKLIEGNAIGVPMKWAEVTVLGPEGNELLEGKEGELAVKGPILMKGYLGGEKAFNPEGWFMTGDLAYYKNIKMPDATTRKIYYLKGRLKEIIIKGGVNISPAAVEDKVKQIEPNVDKVCVVGIPDDRYGEEIVAAVVWKNTNLTVQQMEMEFKRKLSFPRTEISDFEKPAYILTIDEAEIPMTSTRKVQRSVLAKNIDTAKLRPILQIAKNDEYEFILLRSNNKPYMKQALELYNHCWNPLTIDMLRFQEHINNGTVIVAVRDRKVEGFVSMLTTLLSEEELGEKSYDEVTGNLTMSTSYPNGDKVVCIAIGSSNYKPKTEEQNTESTSELKIPTPEEVAKYLEEGMDNVYKFHTREKGRLKKGAQLIKIMPNARPEDKMAFGYNMLMKYPELPVNKASSNRAISPDPKRSMGVQLIEAAMSYAQQCGVKDVYAFSRPAGLREYLTKII